jgi:formylglycine-generating enzyme required for sulfatase activity
MVKGRHFLWHQAMLYIALALLCILPAWSCGKKVKLVYISPGEFMMGSPDSEKDRGSDEGPQHHVRISKGFYMSVTEVTQGQWKAVMGSEPSSFQLNDDNLPVDSISYTDAVEFCCKLSQKEGKGYRLPTEAEWEYACRAGTTTRFYFGDRDSQLSDYAWHAGNSRRKTHTVGQKKPNAFGLYDMHGNVRELCSDWYDEGYYSQSPADDPKGSSTGKKRVLRGGCWYDDAGYCRVATRHYVSLVYSGYDIGFRLVLDIN